MKITKSQLRQIIKEELENFEEVEKMYSAQYSSEMGAERQAGAQGVSDEEKKLYDGALRRRQLRLILAGKMKPEEADELKSIFD